MSRIKEAFILGVAVLGAEDGELGGLRELLGDTVDGLDFPLEHLEIHGDVFEVPARREDDTVQAVLLGACEGKPGGLVPVKKLQGLVAVAGVEGDLEVGQILRQGEDVEGKARILRVDGVTAFRKDSLGGHAGVGSDRVGPSTVRAGGGKAAVLRA